MPPVQVRGRLWSKTSVVSFMFAISHIGLLPSAQCKASAFSGTQHTECRIILMTTTIHFSGLNTEPAPLFHPASYSRYRVCTWISLPTCWLNFSQVGLSRPLGNNNQFHPDLRGFPRSRVYLGTSISLVSQRIHLFIYFHQKISL